MLCYAMLYGSILYFYIICYLLLAIYTLLLLDEQLLIYYEYHFNLGNSLVYPIYPFTRYL